MALGANFATVNHLLINQLVLEGVPFRDAYRQVGQDIEAGTFVPPTELRHTHLGSLGNLGNARIAEQRAAVLGEFDFGRAEEALRQLTE